MHRHGLGPLRGGGFAWFFPALVLPAVLFFVFPALAADVPTSGTYAACMAKALTTLDMRGCQGTGLSDANARLRTVYAKALAALPADQQVKLREAQRRWLAFRSADCGVFFGRRSGTIAPVQSGGCLIDRTETRIKNLRDLLPL
jgi:uncharacterized protein YecT (DUF1311 family)